jgi:hypothetical protein
MAAYRKHDRLGELVLESRADGKSWFIAIIVCVVFAAILGAYAVSQGHKRSLNDVLGVIFMVGVSAWTAKEWWRVRRMVVRLHELGLRYDDGTVKREIAWEDVGRIQAQYVPGVKKKGLADEGNLVTVILTSPQAQVSLPHELHDFPGLVAELKRRSDAPWERVLIKTLMHRG